MYERFYGFTEAPFSLLPDPDFLFPSEKHQTALDLLELAVINRAGFCVISGEIGAGKTTLVRQLLKRVGTDIRAGLVSNTHRSFGELMQWIVAAYGLESGSAKPIELHKQFTDFVIAQYAAGKHTLLIIDEAQNLSVPAMEELRMLSNVNSDKDMVLQMILVGQDELRDKLKQPELKQFSQRVALDYHLAAMSLEETGHYIQHRVVHAGGPADLFNDAACRAVFRYSSGIPRLINRICDLSLVYGFSEKSRVINGALVNAAIDDQHRGSFLDTSRSLSIPAEAIDLTVPDTAQAISADADIPASGQHHEVAEGAAPQSPVDVPEELSRGTLIEDSESVTERRNRDGSTIEQAQRLQQAQAAQTRSAVTPKPKPVEQVPAELPEPADSGVPRDTGSDVPQVDEVPVAETAAAEPGQQADDQEGGPAPSELHELVVNSEQARGRTRVGATRWLLLAVLLAAVVPAAWMSRAQWLPELERMAGGLIGEQVPSPVSTGGAVDDTVPAAATSVRPATLAVQPSPAAVAKVPAPAEPPESVPATVATPAQVNSPGESEADTGISAAQVHEHRQPVHDRTREAAMEEERRQAQLRLEAGRLAQLKKEAAQIEQERREAEAALARQRHAREQLERQVKLEQEKAAAARLAVEQAARERRQIEKTSPLTAARRQAVPAKVQPGNAATDGQEQSAGVAESEPGQTGTPVAQENVIPDRERMEAEGARIAATAPATVAVQDPALPPIEENPVPAVSSPVAPLDAADPAFPAAAARTASRQAPQETEAAAVEPDAVSGPDKGEFSANPCKGAAARFLSTCR